MALEARKVRCREIGDADMTLLTRHFAKPEATVAMSFSDDPQPGLYCDTFSGPAVAPVQTTPLTTAALR